jgi:phage protein U
MTAILSLGTFVFKIDTLLHDELVRRTAWKHERQPRVGARAANQFNGPGDDIISINGTAWAELQDGRASLDQLREMGDQGGIWPLIDGAGRVLGSFVIENLDERTRHWFPNGEARKIDFGLDLARVDDVEAKA